VVQLAKLEGLKVIGSAGSDDKVQFLRDIGVDVAFNYKTTDLDSVLKEHGPIDMYVLDCLDMRTIDFTCCSYWDHVGNQALETTLNHMSVSGRVAVIGSMASYNGKPYAISVRSAVGFV
jgi:NADPH-dependent curcumin reductase CurA